MSKPKGQKTENKKGRVRVGNLPSKEKELKQREAASVKGGGGLSGGVIANNSIAAKSELLHIGEEIPQ